MTIIQSRCGKFTLKQSGTIGQEIKSPTGKILAWTTDPVFGAFICRILNDAFFNDDPLEAIFGDDDVQAATKRTNND